MSDPKRIIPFEVAESIRQGMLPKGPAPTTDQSPWQTGAPPGPGWYLVTVESLSAGYYVMQGHYSPMHRCWRWGNELMGHNEWPEGYPVLAWQPLPEPYRG